MNLLGGIGNFLGGLGHAVSNFIHPQAQPQPQQRQPAQPQRIDLGHFLAQHLGNAVINPVGEIAHDAQAIKARLASPQRPVSSPAIKVINQASGFTPQVQPNRIKVASPQGNPVAGTVGAIGDAFNRYEANNPNLHMAPTMVRDTKTGKMVYNPEAIRQQSDFALGSVNPEAKVGAGAEAALKGVGQKLAQGAEHLGGQLASDVAKVKLTGLTKGIKGSPNFSPELQKAANSSYETATNAQALANHEDFMKAPLAARHGEAVRVLSDPNAQLTKQQVVNYGKTMQHLDGSGKTAEATAIHDLLARKLTNAGQASQAASLLYNRTPEGLKNIAFRTLRNAKVEITPTLKTEIEGHINAIKGMTDGPAKDFATAVLQKAVAKHLPQSKVDNAVSVWKAGLLSGVKTQGGNLVSNGTFGLLKKVADPISTAADKLISLKTGQRTKALTGRGDLSGAGQGFKTAGTTMKTGIDMRNVGDKYEQHAEINLGNKVMQKLIGNPANLIFRGMSAADQPFYYSALKNSMYDQAKADGINAGLRGKALSEHMTKLVQNPTEDMAATAVHEAQKAVLGNDTVASNIISHIQQSIDNSGASPVAKQAFKTAINVLAPFTKVPTAFLSRTIDFTPLGPVKTVMEQISRGHFDQRALSQAIGEGATGTGLVAIGIQLAHNKMLSGDYPKNDQKEQARWKAEGITPNSVKLGNQWVSLNYLGPVGMLFSAGAKMKAAADGGSGAAAQAGQAIAGLGQSLMGQSFLQGFSGFSDAISDPARSGGSFINSQAASLVPNIVNDVGNMTDGLQRQASGVGESIQARIPGLRQNLTPKFDAFGNDLGQPSGSGLQTALNPLKPSNNIDNPMLSELNRLHDAQQTVFPVADKTIGSGKNVIKLNTKQQSDRQKTLGRLLTPLWSGIMQTPEYQAMDDAHKKDALQSALTDANTAVNRQLLSQLAPDQLTKPATARVSAVLTGKATPGDYVKAKTTATTKATIGKTTKKSTGSTGIKTAKVGKTAKIKGASAATLATRARLASAPKAKAAKAPKFKTFSFKKPTTAKARFAKVKTVRLGSSKGKKITA